MASERELFNTSIADITNDIDEALAAIEGDDVDASEDASELLDVIREELTHRKSPKAHTQARRIGGKAKAANTLESKAARAIDRAKACVAAVKAKEGRRAVKAEKKAEASREKKAAGGPAKPRSEKQLANDRRLSVASRKRNAEKKAAKAEARAARAAHPEDYERTSPDSSEGFGSIAHDVTISQAELRGLAAAE